MFGKSGKVPQNDRKQVKNFFLFLNCYPIGVFRKTSTVSSKNSSNDSKIVEKGNFDVFGDFEQNYENLIG